MTGALKPKKEEAKLWQVNKQNSFEFGIKYSLLYIILS